MILSPAISRTVVVVEDDAAMLVGLRRMINAYGYRSETFTSAEQFLAHPAALDILCLVLDINLPGISGIELSRRLSAGGRRIPIVFITARDDEATHEDAAAVGYVAYLRKPFPGQTLIDAIKLSDSLH